jgi:hypothetical protein
MHPGQGHGHKALTDSRKSAAERGGDSRAKRAIGKAEPGACSQRHGTSRFVFRMGSNGERVRGSSMHAAGVQPRPADEPSPPFDLPQGDAYAVPGRRNERGLCWRAPRQGWPAGATDDRRGEPTGSPVPPRRRCRRGHPEQPYASENSLAGGQSSVRVAYPRRACVQFTLSQCVLGLPDRQVDGRRHGWTAEVNPRPLSLRCPRGPDQPHRINP